MVNPISSGVFLPSQVIGMIEDKSLSWHWSSAVAPLNFITLISAQFRLYLHQNPNYLAAFSGHRRQIYKLGEKDYLYKRITRETLRKGAATRQMGSTWIRKIFPKSINNSITCFPLYWATDWIIRWALHTDFTFPLTWMIQWCRWSLGSWWIEEHSQPAQPCIRRWIGGESGHLISGHVSSGAILLILPSRLCLRTNVTRLFFGN